MTMIEYNNTVRDLLGDTSAPLTISVVGADQYGASSFLYGGAIGSTDAASLLDISDKLAAAAILHLDTLLPGRPLPATAADKDAWARDFIASFGLRAYRRPLLPEEAADLFALYQAQSTSAIGSDFPTAIGAVISAVLMAPSFLYRWELGPQPPTLQGNLISFNQYERASRLSYWLWASMPDDLLFQAAAAGELSTPAQIEGQVRRMLKDDKHVGDGISDFHTQWLRLTDLLTLGKDPTLYPSFTPALAASMLAETEQFVMSVLGPQGDGRLQTLLTSTKTFVDARLATLYGVANVTGPGFVPVTLDPAQRAGILTQASFLSSRSNPDEQNPIIVGSTLLRQVLCQDLQKPSNVTIPPVQSPSPQTTIRARYDAHGKQPCAQACHQVVDPPGFAFLNYNAMGAWMSMDGSHPVDATGSMKVGSTTITFQNAVDLIKQLANRPEVSDCMSAMWLRYLNRRLESPGDAQSLTTMRSALAGSSNDIREMLVALATSNAFTFRLPNPGEKLQ
jgi:hypothetical protein